MSMELAVSNNELAITTPVSVQFEETVHLVARNPMEMQNAQGNLKAWLTGKIGIIESEIADLEAAIDHAKQSKWSTAALSKVKSKAVGERVFYQKLLDAVEADYAIVPEFPIDVFAIRVTRELPRAPAQSSSYSSGVSVSDELPDTAPTGEGDYKSPSQMVQRWEEKETNKEGKESTRHWMRATDFQDVVFPVRAARVEVMDATSKAMALKVFDRIGICPPSRRNADPLIIGQVLGRKYGYSQKTVSFLIAWHLNLNEL